MKPIAPTTLHAMACRCTGCRPAANPAEPLTADHLSLLAIAGIIVGLILAEVINWLIGGPGVIPELGL